MVASSCCHSQSLCSHTSSSLRRQCLVLSHKFSTFTQHYFCGGDTILSDPRVAYNAPVHQRGLLYLRHNQLLARNCFLTRPCCVLTFLRLFVKKLSYEEKTRAVFLSSLAVPCFCSIEPSFMGLFHSFAARPTLFYLSESNYSVQTSYYQPMVFAFNCLQSNLL